MAPPRPLAAEYPEAVPLAPVNLALAIPGFLRLGPLQLPVFGVVATAGLLAALALSQRTAPMAGLDPSRLWDAGVLAVLSAFAASRLLLVAVNPRLFVRQPLLVLAQPSLTAGGLVLTAVVVFFWLRRTHLPLRAVLDTWAAPAALLAAVLQLGHFNEGTDAGLPTALPWGVHTPSDLSFARVHPVQLYAAAADLALCLWCLRQPGRDILPRLGFSSAASATESYTATNASAQSEASTSRGRLAALGLVLGGVANFLLGFLRQPYDTLGNAWLDPGQYAALAAVAAGALLWSTVPFRSASAAPARTLREEPS